METPQELSFLTILLPLAAIIFIIAIGVFLLNQHFQHNLFQQKLEQEELKNRQQTELLQASIKAQETERKRIAQDLHDELGATLSIARMHLMTLEQKLTQESKAMESSLQNVRFLTETALTSMRRISHELMPPQLERFGLVKTMEEMARQVNTTGKLTVELNISGNIPRLSWEKEVGLYRICMELIHNTLKHANAKTTTITLQSIPPNLVLNYHDDGKGISTDNSDAGIGLKSLSARANSIGGSFDITNQKGFSSKVCIPVDQQPTKHES